MHALSPCKCHIESNFNFILIPLSVLCAASLTLPAAAGGGDAGKFIIVCA